MQAGNLNGFLTKACLSYYIRSSVFAAKRGMYLWAFFAVKYLVKALKWCGVGVFILCIVSNLSASYIG